MNKKKFDFLWQYVEYWADVDPNLPCIRCEGRTISWGKFQQQSDNLAKSFLAMGLKKGDIIATMLPPSPEYLFSLIAADKIGAILCALDVKYKIGELKRFMAHLEPKVVIALSKQGDYDIGATLQEAVGALEINGRVQYLMVGEERAFGSSFLDALKSTLNGDADLEIAKKEQRQDDGMLIVFTGGTTGVPKAALLSKINVAGMATVETAYIKRHITWQSSSKRLKTIVALPPSHVGGTVEIIGTGIVGGMEMIVQDSWSPTRFMAAIEREKVKWIGAVPTMYAIMLITPEREQYDLSSLQLVVLSGEKVESDLLEGIAAKICPNLMVGYGSTEAGSEVTFTEPGENFDRIADGFVGFPLPGAEIKIVDDEGVELAQGQIGEVLARGMFTIKGYFKMPSEDAVGFTADGYCKTGDLGCLTPEGGLYIKGRKKHIIRVGGYTVMPTEIEEVVAQSSSVGIAAAIGVPDSILGEVVWLVVAPVPGQTVDIEALIRLCEDQLAKFKVPKRIIVRDALPLTRIGKVHRVKLQNDIISKKL